MPADGADQCVLLDAILDAVGDDRVVGSVFVTYQFEPQFFEEHVLAPLHGVERRGSDRVRRVLLEERLRDADVPLVLYDRGGLIADGPLRQRVAAVGIDRRRGLLHAKHVLLLTESISDGGTERSLVMVTTSANLTRSGWWENVECAHVERLEARARTSLAADLSDLIDDLADLSGARPEVLAAMGQHVAELEAAPGLPRLWTGRQALPEFVATHVPERGGTMELVAPFVDEAGVPVGDLRRVLAPEESRVFLPFDREESVAAGEAWVRAVGDAPNTTLSSLSGVDRTRGKGERLRFVHAKVVRLIKGDRAWTLVGSPNLTGAGQRGWRSGGGNIETAILIEDEAQPWLAGEVAAKSVPSQSATEDWADEEALSVRLRFDWGQRAAAVLCQELGPIHFGPCRQDNSSPVMTFEYASSGGDDWQPLTASMAAVLERELEDSGNIVTAWQPGARPRELLVEEEGLAFRPSRLVAELTAADILRHWALLSEARRADHVEQVLSRSGPLDPEAPVPAFEAAALSGDPEANMFERFSGIAHAFLSLRLRVEDAFKNDRTAAVEAWVLGERHDSLRVLLAKVIDQRADDPVMRVLFAVSADEVVELLRGRRPEMIEANPTAARELDKLVDTLKSGWGELGGGGEDQQVAFREWFEDQWLGRAEC